MMRMGTRMSVLDYTCISEGSMCLRERHSNLCACGMAVVGKKRCANQMAALNAHLPAMPREPPLQSRCSADAAIKIHTTQMKLSI